MSWEKYAPTSDSQLQRISRLQAACCGSDEVRRNSSFPRQTLQASSKKPTTGQALGLPGGAGSSGRDEPGEMEDLPRRNHPGGGGSLIALVPTLGDSAKPSGIAALYKESYGGARGSAGADELGDKARERGAQLREYARTCQSFVADIERAVHLLDTIAQQQEQVGRRR